MNNQGKNDYAADAAPRQAYGDDMVSDCDAADALAQRHPKSYRPRTYGMAMDANTARAPQTGVPIGNDPRPGIGVGGAIPIGAFQS